MRLKTPQEKEKKKSRVPYANVVNSLMYNMMCIKLDTWYTIELVDISPIQDINIGKQLKVY